MSLIAEGAGQLVGTGTVPVAFVAYLFAFGAAAVACFASVTRVRLVTNPETRRGLVWLLLSSGAWASAHVGFLLAPTVDLKTAFYVAGLVVGIATVGPWLYFCAAYTGRAFHRDRQVQAVAVAVFLVIVLVKVTNPIHQLYFTTQVATEPFTHLAIRHGLAHWVAMGLAYSLSTVGYFMLLELFVRVDYDTRPFAVLVSLTALPVVLDILGFWTPFLLDIGYEPLGVAAFAVGVTFFYVDRFQAVDLAERRDEPVVVLDAADVIRDVNGSARGLFDELDGPTVVGQPLAAVFPDVAKADREDTAVFERGGPDGTRYYRLTRSQFGSGQNETGRLITLTDVTDRERYRRELERQNDRLDEFASMVSHDLRNPLTVALGRLEFLRSRGEDEHVDAIETSLERMATLVDDLLVLAREGRPIDDLEPVSLATLADRSWSTVATNGAELLVESDLTFRADRQRTVQLLENLFRNALDHGETVEAVTVGALEDGTGFFVADDGVGIPAEERESVFEGGYTTDERGTGLGLAIVTEIVEAHGWSVHVVESDTGGARFEIVGVDRVE